MRLSVEVHIRDDHGRLIVWRGRYTEIKPGHFLPAIEDSLEDAISRNVKEHAPEAHRHD